MVQRRTSERVMETNEAAPRRGQGTKGVPANGTNQTGERSPLNTEQQKLAEQYIPLADSLAKPLKRNWPINEEEFHSTALLALVEAAQSFDPSRNVKFPTFARYRICGALRDFQRALITAGWGGDVKNAPTVTSLSNDSEEKGRVYGAEPDAAVGTELEAIDYVESWLRKLPRQHSVACREIYLNDRSQAETADLMDCSKSRLSYLHTQSLGMLNEAIGNRERLESKKPARV